MCPPTLLQRDNLVILRVVLLCETKGFWVHRFQSRSNLEWCTVASHPEPELSQGNTTQWIATRLESDVSREGSFEAQIGAVVFDLVKVLPNVHKTKDLPVVRGVIVARLQPYLVALGTTIDPFAPLTRLAKVQLLTRRAGDAPPEPNRKFRTRLIARRHPYSECAFASLDLAAPVSRLREQRQIWFLCASAAGLHGRCFGIATAPSAAALFGDQGQRIRDRLLPRIRAIPGVVDTVRAAPRGR